MDGSFPSQRGRGFDGGYGGRGGSVGGRGGFRGATALLNMTSCCWSSMLQLVVETYHAVLQAMYECTSVACVAELA